MSHFEFILCAEITSAAFWRMFYSFGWIDGKETHTITSPLSLDSPTSLHDYR